MGQGPTNLDDSTTGFNRAHTMVIPVTAFPTRLRMDNGEIWSTIIVDNGPIMMNNGGLIILNNLSIAMQTIFQPLSGTVKPL